MADTLEATDEPAGAPATSSGREIAKSNLSGVKKAAVLLVTLGEERAAEVFNHLRPEEIETLSLEMAKTQQVSQTDGESVLAEAAETLMAYDYLSQGGVEFARDVLERSVGSARANEIMGRLSAVIERRPSEFLQRVPAEQVHAFLRDEAPQTVALVLASLHSTLAASVLALLNAQQQSDVATRIATMGKTSPEVVDEVYGVIRQKLANVGSQEYATTGGVSALAEILNSTDRSTERSVLDMLTEADAKLAEEVRALLFVFEDITSLDDRSVQLVLREVDQKDLALALRGVAPEVQETILSNMSQRGSEMLLEEMQYQPPQRRSVVEEAQGRIVAAIRRLEESGEIVLAREGAGEEDAVV